MPQGPGPYALQAAISSLHTLAPSYAETDWEQIAALYELLARSDPSPVIALNRALAVSFAEGPEAALPLLAELESCLADYAPFHAAYADVQRRLGDGPRRARPTSARSRSPAIPASANSSSDGSAISDGPGVRRLRRVRRRDRHADALGTRACAVERA